MVSRPEFGGLLADLARELGLEMLPLDGAGGASFTVDGHMLVHVGHDEDDAAVWISSALGRAAPAERGAVWPRLLAANAEERAADRRCALDPETGVAVLQSRLAGEIDGYAVFEAALLAHVDRTEALARLVGGGPGDAGEGPAPAGPSGREAPPLSAQHTVVWG